MALFVKRTEATRGFAVSPGSASFAKRKVEKDVVSGLVRSQTGHARLRHITNVRLCRDLTNLLKNSFQIIEHVHIVFS